MPLRYVSKRRAVHSAGEGDKGGYGRRGSSVLKGCLHVGGALAVSHDDEFFAGRIALEPGCDALSVRTKPLARRTQLRGRFED